MQIENPYVQYMYSYPHKTAYGPLKDVYLKNYMKRLKEGENSLYFHIPFCQYKCGYCNLFSVAGRSEQWMQEYVNAMERQAAQLASVMTNSITFTDLTLGGGTPLILPEALLEKIFFLAREYFGFDTKKNAVIVETSPNQTTREKLALLKEEGVTRVSIGVQSFVEEELAALHRFHSVDTVRQALKYIKETEFDCMNVDLIYGIPGQTMEHLRYSLEQVLEYEPEELFVYPLYVKPGTFLYQEGAVRAKETYEMHGQVRKFLKKAGYQPHSMRRFVKEGKNSDKKVVALRNNSQSGSVKEHKSSDKAVVALHNNPQSGSVKEHKISDKTVVALHNNSQSGSVKEHKISDKTVVALHNNSQSGSVKKYKNSDKTVVVFQNNSYSETAEKHKNSDKTRKEIFCDRNEKKMSDVLHLPESLCGFGNTLSIGCGGRSYIGDLHFCTPYVVKQEHCLAILKEYIEQKNYLQVSHGFILSEEEQKRRYVIKHLLFGRGINREDYRKHYFGEVQEDFSQLKEWEQTGFVSIDQEYITLTEEGFSLSDYLGPQFISPQVKEKTDRYYTRGKGE